MTWAHLVGGGIVNAAEALKEELVAQDPSAIPLADSLLASTDEMSLLIKQITFLARASTQMLPKTRFHTAVSRCHEALGMAPISVREKFHKLFLRTRRAVAKTRSLISS